MDREKLSEFRELLLRERDRMVGRVKGLEEGGLETSFKDSTGELSSYDNHPADDGSTLFERGKDVGFRASARGLIRRIDEALARIDSGEYGICESCGQPIAEERLRAIP